MTAKKEPINQQNNPYRPNVWYALKEVVNKSMDKGQLPIVAVLIVVAILVWRMPPNDTTKVVEKILDMLEVGHILGWVLSCLLLVLMYFNSKNLRRIHTEEIRRISAEKKELQEQLTGHKLQSSNKKV